MSGKWRYSVYDPILIILQILTLTSLFYFSLTIFIYLIDLIFDFDVNISQIFNYKLIGLNTGYNFFITVAFLINSIAGWVYSPTIVGDNLSLAFFANNQNKLLITKFNKSNKKRKLDFQFHFYFVFMKSRSFYLWLIVSRAKPCLDFSATIYVIHLVLCWIYNQQFPSTFSWWILQIICMSIMCITAEYLCAQWESKPIPLIQKEEI